MGDLNPERIFQVTPSTKVLTLAENWSIAETLDNFSMTPEPEIVSTITKRSFSNPRRYLEVV